MTMEMNPNTMKRVADKVLKAMHEEHLMNKEVAVIFETDGSSMSHLKREQDHSIISPRVWRNMHDWNDSGKPLREFRVIKKEAEVIETEMAAKTEVATYEIPAEAQMRVPLHISFGGPESLKQKDLETPQEKEKRGSKPGRKKKLIASELRSKFEATQKEKKPATPPEIPGPAEETITISRESQKADLSKVDIRTGTLMTIEFNNHELVIRIPVGKHE